MADHQKKDFAIVVACGANRRGLWGDPGETLERLAEALEAVDCHVLARSPVFKTVAVGPGRQPPYTNSVVLVRTPHGPARLLSILRQIEWRAGRRRGVRWGARPLDLDIIDYKGLRLNWHLRDRNAVRPERRPTLVLPHPLAHVRPFVVGPVSAVAPEWRHPVVGRTARELLAQLQRTHQRGRARPVRRTTERP
jgi:2-amino-4-hydroxy-6-hydroxymethyldihydropteridine diphosphokinase